MLVIDGDSGKVERDGEEKHARRGVVKLENVYNV